VIEDLHNLYTEGRRKTDGFMQFSKDLVDSVNARYSGGDLCFANRTFSIAFFDNMIVFEKKAWIREGSISQKEPTLRTLFHYESIHNELVRRTQRILESAGERELVIWGNGINAKYLTELFVEYGIRCKTVDKFTKTSKEEGIDILRNGKGSYFVIVSPIKPKNLNDIKKNLADWGYIENKDYIAVFDGLI
jgi:hypothetical protein